MLVTECDLIAYCRLAFSPYTRESKRWAECRGRVPFCGTNEGETTRLRVVEIATRYYLDRVYDGETAAGSS